MKRDHFCILLLALAAPLGLHAQYYSSPVGAVHVTVPAASDATLSVPLNREPVFQGAVSAIRGAKITISGTPGWKLNQLAPLKTAGQTYAVQFASGAKEGMVAKIVTNTSNTLDVSLEAGNSLTGIVAGDLIDIMPCWTPAALFGNTLPSGTRLLIYPSTSAGINKGPSTTLQYNGTDWLHIANKAKSSHLALRFGDSFVLRNVTSSPIIAAMAGHVPLTMHRTLIPTLAANTTQDVRFGYTSPVKEILGDTGLGFSVGDRLLAYDNSALGLNKKPATTLRYDGSAWIDLATSTDVTRTFNLLPGNGYVYRKAPTPRPVVTVWTDLQSYLAQ